MLSSVASVISTVVPPVALIGTLETVLPPKMPPTAAQARAGTFATVKVKDETALPALPAEPVKGAAVVSTPLRV